MKRFIFLLCSLTAFSFLGYSQVKQVSYDELKKEVADARAAFKVAYELCGDDERKQDSIAEEAGKYLLVVSDKFFSAWYNTPWTFNGHSQIPKKGSIACGYFVTTILRDMGFDIPYVKWAQQASEYLIKKLTTDIKRFHKKSMSEVAASMKERGEGLYIVGLDYHVGYIYYVNGKMSFVHANYYKPETGVMSEALIGRNPLNDSSYRVVGKIFGKEMILRWILGVKYTA